MNRVFALLALTTCACSSSPSRVRLQVSLASDAQAAAEGPLSVSVFVDKGRVIDSAPLAGHLPGDVVIFVEDSVGTVRASLRVVRGGTTVASGAGQVSVAARKEVKLSVALSAGALPDQDADGVPDAIDDCPLLADPAQDGACAADLGATSPDLGPDPCGNGTLDPGEACDQGSSNSDVATVAATCTSRCQVRSPCGSLAMASASVIDASTGHCYVAWSTSLSFTAAETDCNTRGGHLAAVTSDVEAQQVAALEPGSWIGLATTTSAPPFKWTTGESSSYAAFAIGQPIFDDDRTCVAISATGWATQHCGWPATGEMPASAVSAAPYVCEHSCGNGLVDPGEECDPPSASCTATCRNKRDCTEAGGVTSATSGFCYFKVAALAAYDAADASACPMGTHLATPLGPADTTAARTATDTDAWIAVHATTTTGVFSYDRPASTVPPYDSERYHGFLTPDPNQGSVPACAVMTHTHPQGDGWRDRPCTDTYAALCERD